MLSYAVFNTVLCFGAAMLSVFSNSTFWILCSMFVASAYDPLPIGANERNLSKKTPQGQVLY